MLETGLWQIEYKKDFIGEGSRTSMYEDDPITALVTGSNLKLSLLFVEFTNESTGEPEVLERHKVTAIYPVKEPS